MTLEPLLASILAAQAVAVAASAPSLSGHASEIGIAVLLALNGWQIKTTLAYRDEVRRLMQWAFGPEGGNGVNSRINDHDERISELEDGVPHTHKRRTDHR